jgi:deazaflavin-dependent oxidoreductase (nitroreductase family)
MSAHSGQRKSGSSVTVRPPRLGRRVARFNRAVTNRVAIHVAGWAPGLGIVVHVGRRSRTVYRTPVNVFRTKDGFRFALTYGPNAEWVRNALAHGAVRLITRGKEYELTEPAAHAGDPVPRLPPRRVAVAARRAADLAGVFPGGGELDGRAQPFVPAGGLRWM